MDTCEFFAWNLRRLLLIMTRLVRFTTLDGVLKTPKLREVTTFGLSSHRIPVSSAISRTTPKPTTDCRPATSRCQPIEHR